jgi:carotenoid cleavage dioxygenase-like enzyme
VDACSYDDSSVIDALYLDRLRSGGPLPKAVPTRYRMNLDGATATAEPLSGKVMELPRIAYGSHNGRDYRYAYGVGCHGGGPAAERDFLNQLVKLDVRDNTDLEWHEPGCYPGEPVFVPAPGASAEDDGVVLSVVLDSTTGTSFMVVLDARTWQELARAVVPHAIPFGFHGQFARR